MYHSHFLVELARRQAQEMAQQARSAPGRATSSPRIVRLFTGRPKQPIPSRTRYA